MKPDMLEHVVRLAADPALQEILSDLKARTTKKMLDAKTSEERDEHWRDYHAVARLERELGVIAAKEKAKAAKRET